MFQYNNKQQQQRQYTKFFAETDFRFSSLLIN